MNRAQCGLILAFGLVLLLASPAAAQDATSLVRGDYRSFEPALSSPTRSTAVDGVIYAERRYLLALNASGVVAEMALRQGDRVEAGAALVRLDSVVERLEIERLETQLRDRSVLESTRSRLALAREQLQAAEALYDSTGSISRDELNTLRANVLTLQGEVGALELDKRREAIELRIAQAQLAQRTLRAPAAGIVVQLRPSVGEWVQAGDPVVELVDPSAHYVRIHLPVALAQTLTQDQAVAFAVDGLRGEGRVSFVSPVADAASGLVEVRIAFDDPESRFRPGLKAVVEL